MHCLRHYCSLNSASASVSTSGHFPIGLANCRLVFLLKIPLDVSGTCFYGTGVHIIKLTKHWKNTLDQCLPLPIAIDHRCSLYPIPVPAALNLVYFSINTEEYYSTFIIFGARKSQSASSVPLSSFLLSIFTTYVLSGFTISV